MPDAPTDRDLFDSLIELPQNEQDAALAKIDLPPERKARLAKLLLAERRASRTTGFLDRSLVEAVAAAGRAVVAPEQLPKRLGHFVLLRELGSGGMGIVYEAEQAYPHRRVALKLMRADLATSAIAQRFRREIETLGRLQHPNIAQIYEAGTLTEGAWSRAPIPYIAMQLVTGTPLDDWAASERPSRASILSLLATACDAIHHAHQRGVIHRDLKPANILVASDGGTPRPMILDFGIARLTERANSGPQPTLATSAGQILGTIAYMSPEQLGSDPSAIDARTDVYALGVILYELLSGRSPLDVRDRPIADAARIIRDEEPTRLGVLDARLRGDVETIVAKAIEKDPGRRYPTAAALGDELRRHLRDEPILAKPTTRVERIRRFTRRHRAVVVGTIATMIALIAGTIAASAFAARAFHERDVARWQAYRATIAAASAALVGHEVDSAQRYLDAAEQSLRGWEWHYLHHSLDRSQGRVDIPPEGFTNGRQLLCAPSVWPVLALSSASLETQTLVTAPRVGPPPAPNAVLMSVDALGTREIWTDHQLEPTPKSLYIRTADGTIITLPMPHDASGVSIPEVARFSPDGSAIAYIVVDVDFTRRPRSSTAWWRTLDGAQIASVQVQNTGRHYALACGPDGRVGLGGSPSRLPCLWHATTGRVIELRGHTGDINCIALSDDGRWVATGGADRSVHLFDADNGNTLSVARDHLDQVNAVSFSHDGALVVSGSVDRTVRLWRTPELTLVASLDGHANSVSAAEFSPDHRSLISIDSGRTLRIWPADAALAAGEIRVPDNSWGAVDCARDEPIIVLTNTLHMLRLWTLKPFIRERLVSHQPSVGIFEVALRHDARSVMTTTPEQYGLLFDITEHGLIERWRSETPANCVGFTATGEALTILAGTEPALGRLRQVPSMAPVKLPLPRCESPFLHSNRDASLLALRDSPHDGNQYVIVLDARTGEELVRTPAAYGWALAMTTLPNGSNVLATVDREGAIVDGIRTISIRDARSGALLHRLEGHTAHVFALAFSPDGTRLASGGRDRLIRIWDTATWELIASLPGPTSYVWALRFSHDGESLVSSGGDRVYRVWRAPASGDAAVPSTLRPENP